MLLPPVVAVVVLVVVIFLPTPFSPPANDRGVVSAPGSTAAAAAAVFAAGRGVGSCEGGEGRLHAGQPRGRHAQLDKEGKVVCKEEDSYNYRWKYRTLSRYFNMSSTW